MGRRKKLNYSRVLNISDFKSLTMYEESRKGWEVAMALRTLRDHGATSPDALLLGVGAAREQTIFELANDKDAHLVIPSDLYLSMGVWKNWAGADFMKYPGQFVPDGVDCQPWKILPRHADMTALPFEDNTFDGVFSSGSIEHVGIAGTPDYDAISQAAREIARVTKPGGIVSLSTEWKISGDGWGWGHVRLFDEDTIQSVIIQPSGLELLDEPDWSIEEEDAVPLVDIVQGRHDGIGSGTLSDNGFVFTSIHLAMRKPE